MTEITIPILLLGDAAVGKSALLSRISLGPNGSPGSTLPVLRDADQPFIFNISPQRDASRQLTQTSYRLEFFDTAYAHESYTLLQPSMIVMCYAIDSRATLESVQRSWKPLVEAHFNYTEAMPVILLGLKRDLRSENREADATQNLYAPEASEARASVSTYAEPGDPRTRFRCVMPQEGLRVAQEMRCDRYMECSAISGELCREVFEDIVHTAVATSKGHGGGRSEGNVCNVM